MTDAVTHHAGSVTHHALDGGGAKNDRSVVPKPERAGHVSPYSQPRFHAALFLAYRGLLYSWRAALGQDGEEAIDD